MHTGERHTANNLAYSETLETQEALFTLHVPTELDGIETPSIPPYPEVVSKAGKTRFADVALQLFFKFDDTQDAFVSY